MRIAVERGSTAREAVGHVVEAFGQGGNCPFDTGLLIADRHEAYVVNCAGRHWTARAVQDVMAISNRYQIGDDWDLSSLPASDGAKPDFRGRFADRRREQEVAALQRECRALELLQRDKGAIITRHIADILSDIGDDPDGYDIPDDPLPTRICMYAGPCEARFWHATGAMITDSSEDGALVWMTATSATDLACFKPLLFDAAMPDMGPPSQGPYTDGTLW